MRKVIFLLFSVLVASLKSQQIGQIEFKESIKLDFEVNDENAELLKNMPASQSYDKLLMYNESEALYINKGELKDFEASHEEENGEFNIVIKAPDTKVYVNLKDDVYINSQEFFGRYFLITDKIKKYDWKVTGEQKRILDFVCTKAEASGADGPVVVWFTPMIKVKAGPMGFAGLPGMVLAVEQDGGKKTIEATKVIPLEVGPAIEKPSKGKVVSRAEFEKIKEEKMKEMGVQDGKGGTIKMIIKEERSE